ncbi:hypothetical protein VE23_25290 [Paenibacillus sp. D9]|uniref:hypothetical protein n=1 Tax=Paenibacillus sp. D9 TaxID=665792 RepID=UPI00061E36EE|nr:hypothetical protein [Paenibacillus sp. D9]KKC45838.1 hypothetical protein VE23_25290 [Paenibacillus sp. D9]
MDIRTMPAGPELDSLLAIAMKVNIFLMREVSTNWGDTGIAVEEMRRRGYTIHFSIDPDHLTEVEVYRAVDVFLVKISAADGETLPLAATRAFILALRGEKEHG